MSTLTARAVAKQRMYQLIRQQSDRGSQVRDRFLEQVSRRSAFTFDKAIVGELFQVPPRPV
jgi:hypothetical protein